MTPAHVDAAVALLGEAAFDTADRTTLDELVGASQQVHSWLAAIDGRIATAANRLKAAGRSDGPADVLAGQGQRTRKDADAAARRGETCELLPAFGRALNDGDVAPAHADAVADVAHALDQDRQAELQAMETELLALARTLGVEEFRRQMIRLRQRLDGDDGAARHERLHRQRCLKNWRDRLDGMEKFLLSVDPETAAKIRVAHRAAMAAERRDDDERTWDQRNADAFIRLLLDHAGPGGPGGPGAARGRGAEVSVLIDLVTLVDGLHDRSVAETDDGEPVAPEAIRRIACDAGIIPVVLDGDGVVVDLGRAARLASHEQRVALRAMHRTCAYPSCTVGFADCDVHHVVSWLHGGTSDLDNLVPLCSLHHHLVHEGGWTLTLRADRTITLTRPDGEVHHHGPSHDVAGARRAVAEDLVAAIERACRRHIDLVDTS